MKFTASNGDSVTLTTIEPTAADRARWAEVEAIEGMIRALRISPNATFAIHVLHRVAELGGDQRDDEAYALGVEVLAAMVAPDVLTAFRRL
jgi:hypothetical protein